MPLEPSGERMQLLQLKQVPAAVAVMLASVVMIGFTFLIFTTWLHPDLGIGSLANWSDGTWQLAQLDPRGRLLRLGPNPVALALFFGLVVACSVTFALGAWHFFMSNAYGIAQESCAASVSAARR